MNGSSVSTETDLGITFAFPGQGSYSYACLRELYNSFPQTLPHFHQANEVGKELLKGDFLSLVTAESSQQHDERLAQCPDLDQIGIYLTEVLLAQVLIEAGVQPSLLLGHSFGELAALATGGVYSIETGVRIVVTACWRCSRKVSLVRWLHFHVIWKVRSDISKRRAPAQLRFQLSTNRGRQSCQATFLNWRNCNRF